MNMWFIVIHPVLKFYTWPQAITKHNPKAEQARNNITLKIKE